MHFCMGDVKLILGSIWPQPDASNRNAPIGHQWNSCGEHWDGGGQLLIHTQMSVTGDWLMDEAYMTMFLFRTVSKLYFSGPGWYQFQSCTA